MSRPSGFGGRGRGASRRFARACPRESGGPDATPRSRGVGRTNETRGSGIAVTVDLQERTPAGAGAAGAGPPSEPHPGGRTAQCGGLQPASQPQDQGGRQPPRPGRAVRLHQHPSDYGVDEQQPVISVDTKKKELVGDFRNNGREYRLQGNPEAVRVHDFLIKERGRAVPYGVYDLAANSGWVSVGVDHDTAAFAVSSIRQWWQAVGRTRYPDATRLLITADGGGSNGSRVRLWKRELQKLANELGLDIVVNHLPPEAETYCPPTPDRGADLLSVSSPVRRDRAHCQAIC